MNESHVSLVIFHPKSTLRHKTSQIFITIAQKSQSLYYITLMQIVMAVFINTDSTAKLIGKAHFH